MVGLSGLIGSPKVNLCEHWKSPLSSLTYFGLAAALDLSVGVIRNFQ